MDGCLFTNIITVLQFGTFQWNVHWFAAILKHKFDLLNGTCWQLIHVGVIGVVIGVLTGAVVCDVVVGVVFNVVGIVDDNDYKHCLCMLAIQLPDPSLSPERLQCSNMAS